METLASAAVVADFQEAAIAAIPVHLRTPPGETGHTIRFPYTCEIAQAASFS
jgi:hypothetical protein